MRRGAFSRHQAKKSPAERGLSQGGNAHDRQAKPRRLCAPSQLKTALHFANAGECDVKATVGAEGSLRRSVADEAIPRSSAQAVLDCVAFGSQWSQRHATPARKRSWTLTIPTGLPASATISAVIFDALIISSASLAS